MAPHSTNKTLSLIPLVQRLSNIELLTCDYFSQTYATITLRAPRGVTRDAGAKAYAVKLAASPAIIRSSPAHHHGWAM